MAIEFPSFKVRIFHPLSPEHYFFGQAIGRFMLYDDVNANGRRDGDEAFVGTSTNQGILYLLMKRQDPRTSWALSWSQDSP